MKVAIVGGGPAGMFAALEVSKKYSDVTLFDNNPHLGRKLSVTGAGRCNLTNLNITPEAYSSINNFAFRNIINQYDYEFLKNSFEQLGIYTYHTDDGWVYPISNSAKNISILLEDQIKLLGVKILHNTMVEIIEISQDKFVLTLPVGEKLIFDFVIVATGGEAYPQLNANNRLLSSIKRLGHIIIPSYPALAPLITSKNETKSLSGVRQNSTIRIIQGNKLLGSDYGNIIFTDWGINGPGVMNLSHLIHQKSKDLRVEIDYKLSLPDNFAENTIKSQPLFDLLSTPFLSILNIKIIHAIFRKLEISFEAKFSEQEFLKITESLYLTENIIGTRDFEFSQISSGGIDSSQVNTETLESNLCPGLFFAGEILDVMGPCGGYNLHWAFVSGMLAGKLLKR